MCLLDFESSFNPDVVGINVLNCCTVMSGSVILISDDYDRNKQKKQTTAQRNRAQLSCPYSLCIKSQHFFLIKSNVYFLLFSHLLQLGCDVIQTEVRSQGWSPMLPSGSSDGAGWWRPGAAAATARPAAATPTANAVTTTAGSTAAAPCWLLPAAAPSWGLLANLERREKRKR